MKKVLLGFLLGVTVGLVLGIYAVRAFAPRVVVEGVVEYLPPNPGASAVPPEGYYVNSMVYVEGLSRESVGKPIATEGRLGSVPDVDHYQHYPKLFDARNGEGRR